MNNQISLCSIPRVENHIWVLCRIWGADVMLDVLWSSRYDSLCHSGVILARVQVVPNPSWAFSVSPLWNRCFWMLNPFSKYSFWHYTRYSINHSLSAPSPYMLKYKRGATWQHIHTEDKSEGDDNIHRPRPLPTWQYVNFPKSLNREGIIYPSVLSEHSSVLIHHDVEKQSGTCHSVVKVINNVYLLCVV